ncbi:MAG: GDSL-type esterase/lipase family protein [Clostridiales bacterium]|jgi:lysophospholipase L1-like esterase|nr:GDSL-type esterase/lipase family protein [Clostridiales bacterium]
MKKVLAVVTAVCLLVTAAVTGFAAAPNDGIFPDSVVNVVAIGGSLTDGQGAGGRQNSWFGDNAAPGIFGRYLKNTFAGKTVNLYNAGIGGTGSNFGCYRLGRDVISRNPDFVIVEFAINDKSADPVTVKQYMEGIVRQLLRLPKVPYIMFLYTTDLTLGACTDVHDEVAAAYGIPVVNIQKYVGDNYTLEERKAFYGDWQRDAVHPNEAGYQLWGDYIVSKFTEDRDAYFVKPDPEGKETPVFGREFTNIQIVPASEVVNTVGNWTQITHNGVSYYQSKTAGDKLELYFTGSAFGMISLMDKYGADFSLYVDGVHIEDISPRLGYLASPMQNTYFSESPFRPGWHKAEVVVKPLNDVTYPADQGGETIPGAQRLARVGFFFVDREETPPPKITHIEMNGGRKTELTEDFVRFPADTSAFSLFFDQPIDLKTATAGKVTVRREGTVIPANVQYDFGGKRFEVTLTAPVQAGVAYSVTVDKSVAAQDTAMRGDFVLGFESTVHPAFLSASFADYAGNKVSGIGRLNYVTANIAVENTLASDGGMTLYAALYRGGELLRFSKAASPAFQAGVKKKYTAGFVLPTDKTNLEIRVYVLDADEALISREVVFQ